MEKRKLLLVAVSVGVFLVIVLSAAILIFTPSGGGAVIARPGPSGESASGSPAPRLPASADAADMVRNAGDLQGLRVPPPGSDSSGTPASASAVQENNFYFNGDPPAAERPVAERPESGSGQVVINVPQPSAPGVPASSRSSARPAASTASPAGQRTGTAGSASPAPSRPASSPAASGTKPAAPGASSGAPGRASGTASSGSAQGAVSGTKPAASAVAPAAASAVASPASSAASGASSRPRARSQEDYWIQTGAFSALVRAESAKEILASKGLVSIIDDREVEGQTWYRVRVGPYTSENEANYWLALVRAIDGFNGSQVRSSRR